MRVKLSKFPFSTLSDKSTLHSPIIITKLNKLPFPLMKPNFCPHGPVKRRRMRHPADFARCRDVAVGHVVDGAVAADQIEMVVVCAGGGRRLVGQFVVENAGVLHAAVVHQGHLRAFAV